MSELSSSIRGQIITLLCLGSSLASIARICGVSTKSVSNELMRMGALCSDLHDREVRNVRAKRIRLDRTRSFASAGQSCPSEAQARSEFADDICTWTALDTDSRLILAWLVGGRDADDALALAQEAQSRLVDPVQITTDRRRAYLEAVNPATVGEIDYSPLLRWFGAPEGRDAKVGPRFSRVDGFGMPTHPFARHRGGAPSHPRDHEQSITTSARLRLTNDGTDAFTEDLENFVSTISLYVVWYNFVRVHSALKTSPAMAAGISRAVWSLDDLCVLMDERGDRS